MSVVHGSAGSFAMIFEDQNVAEPLVIFEIEHAVAISPEDVFDGPLRERSQSRHVVGRFHNDFMRADAVHLVKEAFAFSVEIAFNTQRWEFVRHHTNRPACCVRAAVAAAVDENLWRRLGLIARAERAILGVWRRRNSLAQKIVWTLSTLGGNNHPAASNRVFSQLRQSSPPRKG